MINEALENTIEEMTDEQALYLEATDSDLMDEIFSGWTQDVRIFALSSYHSLDIVIEQEDRLQTLLERFDQHLAEPHVQGLKINGWTSDFVTPLSDQLAATQSLLLQAINNR